MNDAWLCLRFFVDDIERRLLIFLRQLSDDVAVAGLCGVCQKEEMIAFFLFLGLCGRAGARQDIIQLFKANIGTL